MRLNNLNNKAKIKLDIPAGNEVSHMINLEEKIISELKLLKNK